jgi:hypothetical protein
MTNGSPEMRRCGHARGENGAPCRKQAGAGTDHVGWGHCKYHGGASPNGRAYAARLRAEALVAERRLAMTFYRVDLPDISPEAALLEEVRRSAGIVRWLQMMIEQWRMDPEDVDAEWARLQANKDQLRAGETLADGDEPLEMVAKSSQTGLPKLGTVVYFDKGGTVAPTEVSAWLRLYMDERAHLTSVCKAALSAGVQERLVRLAEQEVDTIVAVIRASITEMGLEWTPDRVAIVGRQLRAIGGRAG